MSLDKEYEFEVDSCAEVKLVEGNAYNNTSMLADKRTIFRNSMAITVSRHPGDLSCIHQLGAGGFGVLTFLKILYLLSRPASHRGYI